MTRQVIIVGGDGAEHVLACPGGPYHLRPTAGLWGGIGHQVVSRQVAGIPGRRLENVTARTNVFAVPIAVEAATQLDLDQKVAYLATVLDPQTDVIVRYVRPDGVTREITARLRRGFENITFSRDINWVTEIPLEFEAFVPFWRATAENIQEVTATWNNGLFAGSNPLTIVNNGDVEVWPEIIITGESENVSGVNLITGEVWRIKQRIQLGQTVRIVTEPENRAVYLDDFLDWSIMDEYTGFWPLVPRTNNIILRGIGPASADIGGFTLRWRELYQTC